MTKLHHQENFYSYFKQENTFINIYIVAMFLYLFQLFKQLKKLFNTFGGCNINIWLGKVKNLFLYNFIEY